MTTRPAIVRFGVLGVGLVVVSATAAAGCNSERKQQCDRFVAVMKPLAEGNPTPEAVESVNKEIGALGLTDQPLQIYGQNYQRTLTALASTLRLQATPSAPDGTDDVVKRQLKDARTDLQDLERYCAQ